MAKITNTTDDLFYIGEVEIKPHSTVEIADAALKYAKHSKAIMALLATGRLAEGDTAERREAANVLNPPRRGPAALVRPKQEQ